MNTVILIDDEPLARSILIEFLNKHTEFQVVAECNNGYEGIKAIETHQPDLVFLDIQMPKINGFEMLELLDNPPSVIFTTAYDEYALKAFETSAIDYLLKPFSQERFDQALDKWERTEIREPEKNLMETTNKQPDEHLRIVIKDGANIKIIPTEKVSHIEAYDDYVKIHAEGTVFLKKKTMSYYENTLDGNHFVRVHRSFIININELTGIQSFEKNSYRAILKNGERIPISRSAYAPLKELLGV